MLARASTAGLSIVPASGLAAGSSPIQKSLRSLWMYSRPSYGVFHHFELAHQLHRAQPSAPNLLHLAVGAAEARRPSARTGQHISADPYHGLPAAPHAASIPPRWTRASTNGTRWPSTAGSAAQHRTLRRLDRNLRSRLDRRPKVQSDGGKFICDRGSTHQRFQEQVLAEEYRRWKCPPSMPAPHIVSARRSNLRNCGRNHGSVECCAPVVPRARRRGGKGPRNSLRSAAGQVHARRSAAARRRSRFSSLARSACAKAFRTCWRRSRSCVIRRST